VTNKRKTTGTARRRRLNCWEFNRCGRGLNGGRDSSRGVCPTATAKKADGVHGGRNGGRVCWAIAGTLCDGRVAGTYAAKIATCAACDFHRLVQQEEHVDFHIDEELLRRLT